MTEFEIVRQHAAHKGESRNDPHATSASRFLRIGIERGHAIRQHGFGGSDLLGGADCRTKRRHDHEDPSQEPHCDLQPTSSFKRARLRSLHNRAHASRRTRLWGSLQLAGLDASCRLDGHPTLRFSADSFPRLLTISYWTIWPSLRLCRPAFSTAEMWTNTSLPPP